MHQGTSGTSFAVWAPGARAVRVVGDFNGWDGRINPMRALGSSGVWEIFLPGVGPGAHYKYEVVTQQGEVTLRADPFAFAAEVPPATASIVARSSYEWRDEEWFAPPGEHRPDACPGVDLRMPSGVVAVHPGRRRRVAAVDLPGSGRRAAAYLHDLGFTHVEFMPIAQHPFAGSWGYQVTGFYAPTACTGHPTTSATWSTGCTGRVSGCWSTGCRAFPQGRLGAGAFRRHRAVRARRPPAG